MTHHFTSRGPTFEQQSIETAEAVPLECIIAREMNSNISSLSGEGRVRISQPATPSTDDDTTASR